MNQQTTLFGRAADAQEASVPFAQVLLGLATVKGLGRKALKVLVGLLNSDLARVWTLEQHSLAQALAAARVPSADAIAHTICTERDSLLEVGLERHHALLEQGISVLHGEQLPKSLREVSDPPDWLFIEGSTKALTQSPFVAVVGTRQASSKGLEAAETVAKVLAAYPITLVSGLAEGIDDAAHRASLELDVGNVAFLGTGIDVVFPKETAGTRERIVDQGGAVVSEYLPGESYGREKFVARNRLQAGLADLVIPVEAKQKSGTAHTVRFARELKRLLLGLRWKGNNGLLDDLKAHNDRVLDAFTKEGWRELDTVFRTLAEAAGHNTYALTWAERRLLSEIKARSLRVSDVQRLRNMLDEVERTLK